MRTNSLYVLRKRGLIAKRLYVLQSIATLLSYIELHPAGWLENYNHTYAKCTVRCYGGPRQLMDVARKCPPVAVAIARQKLEGWTFSDSSHLELRVVDICDSMGWQSATVKRQLKDLQWESGPHGFRKSGVLVELSDLAFHFRSRGDLTSNEMDGVLDFLSDRVLSQERAELTQLDMLSDALWSVSHKNYWMCCDEADKERSDKLKTKLEDFFHSRGRGGLQGERQSSGAVVDVTDSASINQLTSDIRHFISLYGQDHTLTGRAIARIFHGIASPCFPAETWGRVRRFWRAHLHLDFNLIIREATRLIVAMK